MAALLTDARGPEQSGALEALEFRGFAAAELRKEFFDFVRGSGDDDTEWSKILLGREVRTYRMAGFHADDTRGEDLLGIEQDVLAFATLIAARTVTPPLSIGLFGEWGSGKSFFMRHLRNAVAGLAREAANSGQMQRDLHFYKRIVQIEFNAWHYVEGNLWASLVEHIFRNLSIPGDQPTASQALQKRLMDDLKFTEQARAQVDEERRRALAEVATARKRVSAARREHERQREALAELAAKEVASDLTVEEVRSAVGPVLERLGVPAVAASAQDLLGALADARALVERGRGVAVSLVRGPERWRRTALLLMVMLLGPVVYWLVGVLVRRAGDEAMAQLTAFASGAATLLTAGAAWVRSQVKWGSDRLAEVEKAQREVDRRLAEKQAEQTRELRILQEQLQLVRADYEAARRRQVESETRVKEAKTKLEEGSVARLLASFIEDRAASADYRKHLGVLALVRNDFEKLSGLIEEENWCLSPPGHDDGRYPGLERFATLEMEKEGAASRINRIVLYIDDLDRCPPNKVVEVLQAVHLLLAFPLFVVVVGVDARWVKRSLEVRYREFLHAGNVAASVTSADLLIGKATTDDYLEKIFQIPFWLRPMDEAHTGRMVRGLLEGSVAASSPPDEAGLQAKAAAPIDPAAVASEVVEEVARRAGRAALSGEAFSPPEVEILPDQPRQGATETVEAPQVNLESLVFHPEEQEFIAAIAPLLDRSPRALKRFVNVYRLIKAGLTPAEQRAFMISSEGRPAPSGAVLFLLAVDTGLPEVAEPFFAALRATHSAPGDPGTGEGAATLRQLVEGKITELGGPFAEGRPWTRLRVSVDEREFDPPLALLAEWEPRVMRYSFRAQG
ncbi:MAG TPA: P-loop NTPase fold protein [Longimicrobiaceae bacterium]|nr:P-loop NTPase fold protein [Longimicrobiaceae bacterium]